METLTGRTDGVDLRSRLAGLAVIPIGMVKIVVDQVIDVKRLTLQIAGFPLGD